MGLKLRFSTLLRCEWPVDWSWGLEAVPGHALKLSRLASAKHEQ